MTSGTTSAMHAHPGALDLTLDLHVEDSRRAVV